MLLRHIARIAIGISTDTRRTTVKVFENPELITKLLIDAFSQSIGFNIVSKDVREEGFRRIVRDWIITGKDLRQIGEYFKNNFNNYWVKISPAQAQVFSEKFKDALDSSHHQTEEFPTPVDQELVPILLEARYCLSPSSRLIDGGELILKVVDRSCDALETLIMIVSAGLCLQYGLEKKASQSIADLLTRQGKYCVLLLIDGIDEIPYIVEIDGKQSSSRFKTMELLAESISRIDAFGHQMLVSSRPGDPDAHNIFRKSSIIEICELPDSWQYKFINNLTESAAWKDYKISSREVIRQVEDLKSANDDIAKLTRIPLLLTGISTLMAEGKITQSTSKLQIIKQWSDKLINKRAGQLGLQRFDAMQIASRIAAKLHQIRSFSISEHEVFALAQDKDKSSVENLITQSGLFYVRGDTVAFIHRLFQSYYHSQKLIAEIRGEAQSSERLEKALYKILLQEEDSDFLIDALVFLFQELLTYDNNGQATETITRIIRYLLNDICKEFNSKRWGSKSLTLLEASLDAGLPSALFEADICRLCEESLKPGANQKLKIDYRLRQQLWRIAETLKIDDRIVNRNWILIPEVSSYISSHLALKADFLKFYENIASGYNASCWYSDLEGLENDSLKSIQESRTDKYQRAVGGMATAITEVCWYEARAYCAWATEKIRGNAETNFLQLPLHVADLVRSGTHELRMLTSQEWLKVAKHEWLFENLDEVSDFCGWANTKDDNTCRPLPAGIFYSTTGIFDLIGNVREWCSVIETLLDKNGSQMAPLVGGAWNVRGQEAREILYLSKTDRNGKFGFRLSCAPVLRDSAEKSDGHELLASDQDGICS
jgi:hypothetical protein